MKAFNATCDHYIRAVNNQEYWEIIEYPKPEPPKLKDPSTDERSIKGKMQFQKICLGTEHARLKDIK